MPMPSTYPPELEQFIKRELASGQYQNEDELLVEALKAFRELKTRHDELRADVERSIEQADRGEVAALDMGALKQKLQDELGETG